MISLDYIRQDSNTAKKAFASKGANVDIDRIVDLDKKHREVLQEVEELRAKRNTLSQALAKMSKDERQERMSEAEGLKNELREKEGILNATADELNKMVRGLPNPPAESVPVGSSEADNVIVRTVGKPTSFSFEPKDYLALAETHDLIDIERAAKVSGSRFGYIKNEAVLLEFALVRFALDVLAKEGFSPIVPPALITADNMEKLGYLEKEPDDIYYLEKDDMYLIGTAEHSIVPMYSGETFAEGDLPKRFVGFSSAFRREAGSYGKDTKGILRVHQFDKLEMVSFTTQERSAEEHAFLLSLQERLMQALEIPYQVVHLSTGDMGFVAHDQYDIESWVPSENKYRETHSTSNTADFQARRLNIRYQGQDGTKLAHILNGTAFAIGRTIIALLENRQNSKGEIDIPKALRPYTGFKKIS